MVPPTISLNSSRRYDLTTLRPLVLRPLDCLIKQFKVGKLYYIINPVYFSRFDLLCRIFILIFAKTPLLKLLSLPKYNPSILNYCQCSCWFSICKLRLHTYYIYVGRYEYIIFLLEIYFKVLKIIVGLVNIFFIKKLKNKNNTFHKIPRGEPPEKMCRLLH